MSGRESASRRATGIVAALLIASGVAFGQAAPAAAQEFPGNNLDIDTGLRCLTRFCQYVRSPRSRECICKKIVTVKGGRRNIRLECRIFNTQQTCRP